MSSKSIVWGALATAALLAVIDVAAIVFGNEAEFAALDDRTCPGAVRVSHGARELRRHIRDRVEDPLTEALGEHVFGHEPVDGDLGAHEVQEARQRGRNAIAVGVTAHDERDPRWPTDDRRRLLPDSVEGIEGHDVVVE